MSIEAVLLFLSVRKLKQVKPNDRAGLHWKLSLLIGYGIPLVIVGVSLADLGRFDCEAKSRIGGHQKSMHLDIECKYTHMKDTHETNTETHT